MTVTRHDTRDEGRAEMDTGPGHRLREARLANRITLDEVAARLHLDTKLVEALESDQYAELPEPTFVRGYLRGYARLLDLPPAPIIESYDRHGFGAPELIPDIGSKPQAQSSDTSVRLVSFVVAGVLVVLMVSWWHSQQNTIDVYPGGIGPETDEPAVLQEGPTDVEIAIESPGPSAPPVAPSTPDPEPAISDTARQVALAEPAELERDTPPTEVAVALIETPESSIPSPDDVGTPEIANVSVAPPSTVPPAPGTSTTGETTSADRLEIRFQHDSWVEIYDRDEAKLYYGLAKGGVTVSVTGKPPLQVLLGYAEDVRIEYNGKPFDPAPYIRRDVARFTLGEAAAQ